MSILSALKLRGAKGKNIEEAVKTLPLGGSNDGLFIINVSYDDENDKYVLDKTFAEIVQAASNGLVPILYDDDNYYQCFNAYIDDEHEEYDTFNFMYLAEVETDVLTYSACAVYKENDDVEVEYTEGTVSNSGGGSDTNGTVSFSIVNENATPKVLQYYNNGDAVTGQAAYSALIDLVGGASINKVPILLYGGLTTNLDNYHDVYYYSGSNSGGDSGFIYAIPVMRTLDGKQAVIDRNGEVTFSS